MVAAAAAGHGRADEIIGYPTEAGQSKSDFGVCQQLMLVEYYLQKVNVEAG